MKLLFSMAMASSSAEPTLDHGNEVANPFILQNGEAILDGDEDSQVAVYEFGEVTPWALQWHKWRVYFGIKPDDIKDEGADPTSESTQISSEQQTIDEDEQPKKKQKNQHGPDFELN